MRLQLIGSGTGSDSLNSDIVTSARATMFSSFNAIKNNVLKNRILVENFTFLSVLQVSNLVLFIITIPYLFRVVGSQNYGLIVFAQTVAFYFSILINFGFNLTATRDVSVNRNDPAKVSEILSAVLSLKVILFFISLLLMVSAVFISTEVYNHRFLFIFSMAACLSDALFPIWYFQGIEKMKYITFINVTTRIVATVMVFILILKPADYLFYPLIMGSGMIAGSITGLVIVLKGHSVKFRFQPVSVLRSYFNDNLLYFLSNVSTQIYVNANKIIIGSFLGMVSVAYYDVADKVINILKVPYSLLGQTLFPKVSRDRDVVFLRKILAWLVLGTAGMIIIIFLASPWLVKFFSGSVNENSVWILRILSFSLLPISVSLIYGDLVLINFGLKNEYAKLRFMGLFIYVMFITISSLMIWPVEIHLCICLVIVETFIALFSYKYCKRSGITLS
ncbi:MAG: oligosaccharide flippase family protein [Bacteroidales bacterium]